MGLCLCGVLAGNVGQGQTDLDALVDREIEMPHGFCKSGDVAEGQLDIEETLMEQLARGAVGDGAGVAQLGIDHEGCFVEPDELMV